MATTATSAPFLSRTFAMQYATIKASRVLRMKSTQISTYDRHRDSMASSPPTMESQVSLVPQNATAVHRSTTGPVPSRPPRTPRSPKAYCCLASRTAKHNSNLSKPTVCGPATRTRRTSTYATNPALDMPHSPSSCLVSLQPHSTAADDLGHADHIPEFGGGILAHKQSKKITRFYGLQPRRDAPLNVIAHNATTIRNLAEIRHRETVPPIEIQYRTQDPMVMRPVAPEPLPVLDTKSTSDQAGKDNGDAEKAKSSAMFGNIFKRTKNATPSADESVAGRDTTRALAAAEGTASETAGVERASAGAGTASREAQTAPSAVEPTRGTRKADVAETGKPRSGFSNLFSRSHRPAASADETDAERAAKEATGTGNAAMERFVTTEDRTVPFIQTQGGGQFSQFGAQSVADNSEASPHEGENAKGKVSSMLKRDQKSKERDQTTVERSKAVEDLQQFQGSGAPGQVGEGLFSEEAKAAALKRCQDMLESGEAGPLPMFMTAENLGALDAIVELPPVRAHSISEDTVVVGKPASQERHSLSSDVLMAGSRPVAPHTLAQDKVINVRPSRRGGHRLSADAMVSVRTAAPGHYLDEDPAVSGPQHLFPHELLEDVRVLRPRSPQAHGLDLDKKLAVLQKQIQPHSLHNDTVLPVHKDRAAHSLDSDQIVTSDTFAQGSHDMTHDVRILSPGSGQVRNPHGLDEDEIIRETAVFRKSPHPDATMPGNWASSSSGGENEVSNPIATLNASLHSANQALGELNRALGPSEAEKENAASGM